MSQMLKSSGQMGLATLLSRILGVVRESLYAAFMGDGPVAGAFKLAFMIPNLFRRLLGEGALTAAFIPLFKEQERNAGEAEMWKTANSVISGLIVASALLIVTALAGLTLLLATDWPPPPGVGTTMLDRSLSNALHSVLPLRNWLEPETRLMIELTRVMFPYLLLICLAAVLMGMLNARGRFFIPAMGAIVLNLVMIIVVLFVAPRFGARLETQIFALAIGVLVAGLAQALYQLPALYGDGFRLKWISPFANPVVRSVVSKMIPGMLGVAAFQVNVLVTQSVAYAFSPQIVASFDYAVRLMEFPQGLFGISLATYLLPTLSGLAADKNYADFRSMLRQALGYLTLANLLASVLLIALARPIVRLIFERGEFTELSTERATLALVCLAPGLLAFSTVNILARCFYALGDTKTPMRISVVCLTINLLIVLWLIPALAQGGLGIANTLSACLNMYLLFYALRKKLARLDLASLKGILLQLALAGAAAGAVAWFASALWENNFGHGNLALKAGAVFFPAGLASLFYMVLLLTIRCSPAIDLWNMVAKRRASHS